MSKKDELLGELDFDALLELAKSVSDSPIRDRATRADLRKIVKGALSIEEIKRKIKGEGVPAEPEELTGDDLIAGGIGQLLLAVSGAINVVAYLAIVMVGGSIDYYGAMARSGLVSSAILLVFAILLRVTVVKITWKAGGGLVGTATCLLAFVTALTGIVNYALVILKVTIIYMSFGYTGLNALGVALQLSYAVLLGVMMASLGTFLLLYREYSPSSDLWMAGGIIYIVAGASEFSVMSSLAIPGASFVAGIIGAACFFSKKATK